MAARCGAPGAAGAWGRNVIIVIMLLAVVSSLSPGVVKGTRAEIGPMILPPGIPSSHRGAGSNLQEFVGESFPETDTQTFFSPVAMLGLASPLTANDVRETTRTISSPHPAAVNIAIDTPLLDRAPKPPPITSVNP